MKDDSPDSIKDPIKRFVAPLYLHLLGGQVYYLSESPKDDKSRLEFEEKFRKATSEIDISDLEAIFEDKGWRTQLVASWFCALKSWSQFRDRIGDALLQDALPYAGPGYCLALYSFADEKSISYLCKYLDEWLHNDDSQQQANAIQALYFLDEKLGTQHAAKYSGENGAWTLWHERNQERTQNHMIRMVMALEYLSKIDA